LLTHNLADGIALADRIAVMHRGKFEQVDSAVKLMREPANAYVADFFKAEQFSHPVGFS
jgi:ABC-type proline/glycine betaine transport system ATPase subunit